MDELNVKNRIAAALQEPEVPRNLVERTVVRARAITAGRAAEQKLAEQGDNLPARESAELTARSVVGRLMLTAEPPAGADETAMAEQLMASEKFRMMAALPAEKRLQELRSGDFLSRFRETPEPAARPEPAPEKQRDKTGPEPPGIGQLSR